MRPPTPSRARARARLALGALAPLVLGVAACEIDPEPVEIDFSLNTWALSENEALLDDATAQAHIRGSLEMLFGTPSAPGYLRPEEWIDAEYDPNHGSSELSDEEWEALQADNESRFSRQLELLAEGRLDEVHPPREALDFIDWWDGILADWNELRAEVESGESEASKLDEFVAESKEVGRLAFVEWYPTLRESAELYRLQCLHCHGPSGGGDGPTADFLEPRPRDYRRGIFKFTALKDKSRPRRADLYRTLSQGVPMTAMPSFRRFSTAQLQGLVDYVRLLSIRGETEVLLAVEFDEFEGLPLEVVKESYLEIWSRWDEASEYVIAYDGEVPFDDLAQRIEHGRELFMDPTSANCVSCHGADGRGGGVSAFEVNSEGETVPVKDDWGHDANPRDLTKGIFRGGRRPIDLFRRIYAGINGTPMPSHASLTDPDGNRLLSDEDLWDIVHYVRSLSSHD